MAKKRHSKATKKRKAKISLKILLLIIVGVSIGGLVSYNLAFSHRIFPGVYVAGVNLSGLTSEKAVTHLSNQTKIPSEIILVSGGQTFKLPLSSVDFSYNFSDSAEKAYRTYRTGNLLKDLYYRALAPVRRVDILLTTNVNQEKLKESLSVIAGQISVDPIYPSAKIVKGKVLVDAGKPGKDVDIKKVEEEIELSLSEAKNSPILLPITTPDPSLSEEEAKAFGERAEKYLGKTLSINFEFQTFTYKGNALIALLNPREGVDTKKLDGAVESIVNEIERPPQNPAFVFDQGKVKEFAPAKDGIKTKKEELKTRIRESVVNLENSKDIEIAFEVPVERTPSEIKTGEVNNLGIKELVGRGVSRFRSSIPSRIHNITLAASRLNGVLIKPGEVLSFNDALGDVSKFTGYKEAYIIKEGKTILGDGGGVCQVSSTLFRATLNAGLPIVERRAHAYRVGYYEQDSPPGFDATVYAPTTDLKIKNDTPGHILIQTSVNPKTATLVFELYGTKDGRIAGTSKPQVTDVVPAPEDLYHDDPTIPSGKIKQVDYKANGAKVTFSYKVTRGSEVIHQKTFISNYRPWQAVYLRGVGPVQ